MNAPLLTLEGLTKNFDETKVLKNISLSVNEGEFLTFLGPSGCGKTTTLRILAGLESPTSGRVLLNGEDITELPPEKRPINTVFQNYALFPHMNVKKNIAYGLKFIKCSKAEKKERVAKALELVQLSGFEKRMPDTLSGGQKQRIAIARAIALRPKVLLLDEPLGALDLKLRQEMQKELKQLQQKLGITFIYITHDQEEAMNMSDRIVVMRDGIIKQVDTPENIYEKPISLFVADFIGQSNLIKGTLQNSNIICNDNLQLPVCTSLKNGEKVVLCIRPQRIFYCKSPKENTHLKGIIQQKTYTGGMQQTLISLSNSISITAINQNDEMDSFAIGSEVYVGWNIKHAPVVIYEGDEL